MSPAVCRCFSDSRVLDRYAIAAAGSSPCSAGGDGAAVGTAASARGGPPVGTATSAPPGGNQLGSNPTPGCNQLALGGASPDSGAGGTTAGAGADMRTRPAAPQTATTTSSPTRFHLAARRVSRRSRPHAPFEYLGSYIPALDPPAVARINHSASVAGCGLSCIAGALARAARSCCCCCCCCCTVQRVSGTRTQATHTRRVRISDLKNRPL